RDFEKHVTEFTLANGMHFIVLERHNAPVVSFHSYVNAGAVNDPGGETGLAHMFEHMAFKGTQTIGTSNYPAEKKAMLEAQRFYDPIFREFYKERDVVREERRMRVESSPQGRLVEALLSTAFAAHPYRNSAAGWASDIENLRVTDALKFYKQYYVPANITIGIAGDVDPRECRRLADRYFAIIPAGPPPAG